jgi:YhhN family
MVAIIAVAAHRRVFARSRYSLLIIGGLICSLAGDVLLMLPSDQFVAGLVSFSIAHFFHIAAFRTGIRGLSPVALALPFYGAGAVLFWILSYFEAKTTVTCLAPLSESTFIKAVRFLPSSSPTRDPILTTPFCCTVLVVTFNPACLRLSS